MIALAKGPDRANIFVRATTVLLGAFMLLSGLGALLMPKAFAELAQFPLSEHFVHDAGAFQIGIGVTLLAALYLRDGMVIALLGFLVSNTIHAVNHAMDLHLGGEAWHAWLLSGLSLLTLGALIVCARDPTPLAGVKGRA